MLRNTGRLAFLGSVSIGASLMAQTVPAPTDASPESEWVRAFGRTTRDDRPLARWWWPGGDVTDGEITREIGVFDAAGFGGLEVQPFNPGILGASRDASARINDYATPGFFAHMRTAVAQAGSRGMTIDYTFGSGWPTGGGFAITPQLALRELTMARTEVAGGQGGQIKVDIPRRSRKMGAFNSLDPRSRDPRVAAAKVAFDAIDRIVAVVAVKGSSPELKPEVKGEFKLFPWQDVVRPGTLSASTRVVLTDRLRKDGTLDWQAPAGRWQVFVFKEFAANAGVSPGVGAGPQLVADHFDRAAFAAHAARVGDPLIAALGPVHPGLGATFIDSFELMPDIYWSRDFLEQFEKRRGYDLTPHLPFVLQPGWMQAWNEHYSPAHFEDGDLGDRIRSDYRQTVSDLMIERFIEPFVAWNRSNGVKARLQAHGSPTDMLRAYGLADIPETEDLADGGNPYFMRLARSAADIYGRRLIGAESLVWPGKPYSATLWEMRTRADRIFASGVNRLVYHGVPYAYQRDRWPGWHAFAPIAFSPGFSSFLAETNPIWPGVSQLNGYVTRMQALLRQGRSAVPVAVLLGETGFYPGIETKGQDVYGLERRLLAGGYDYDRINDDALEHAKVVKGRLTTAGGASFPALVVPKVSALPVRTAERIARLARAGLVVRYVDALPTRDQGFLDHVARDRRVRIAVDASRRAGAKMVAADDLGASLRAARVPANLRFMGDATDLVFVQRQIGGRTMTFVHNAGEIDRDASLMLPSRGAVSRWDAMDEAGTAVSTRSSDEGEAVVLRLKAGESALLMLDPAAGAVKPPAARMPFAEQALSASGWTLMVDGHGDDRQPVRRNIPITALQDFSDVPGLAHFSGTATYTTSFSLDPAWRRSGTKVMLDLGEVHDMATVTVNGRTLPPRIVHPWRVDVTSLLSTAGPNSLAIAVANVPNNAMIDPAKPVGKTFKPVAAGLVGPVRLIALR